MEICQIKKNNQSEIIRKAIVVLKQGKLIVYPTETCYGLGADATNKQAVDQFWRFKENRRRKPVLIAVATITMAKKYGHINNRARKIFTKYLPGPVAIVVKGRHKVDHRIESEKGTLGIRQPDYPLILKIIQQFGQPITSTSANPDNQEPPYSIEQFLRQNSQKDLISLFIDAGTLQQNMPSTIVDTTKEKIKILRRGPIKIQIH